MTKAPNIESIYNDYITEQNNLNREKRYTGKEKYYHASAANSCSRKLYYESVALEKTTNEPKKESYRKMRLGTIFHNEMEDCFNSQPSNGTGTGTITGTGTSIPSSFKVHQENEIIIEELNVRGFYDLVLEMSTGEVYLYDFKTMASFPWKLKFGNKPVFKYSKPPKKNLRYEYQLGTYGYAIRKEFSRLDGMFLVYYNKDTSAMKQLPVDLKYVNIAYQSWKELKSEHSIGLPPVEDGVSPKEPWECNYCNFKDLCYSDSPQGYKSVQ